MAEVRLSCFHCGRELVYASVQMIGRREECPQCRSDVHVCRNCRNYDKAAYNECREPQADIVREKDRANFCDYFTPAGPGQGPVDKKKELLAAAEALFKKK